MFVKDHPLFAIKPFNSCADFLAHLKSEMSAVDLDPFDYMMDHICWRCDTVEEYITAGQAVMTAGAQVLVEGMIGGRPITTFKLNVPITITHSDDTIHEIPCIEIPAPKPGRHYPSGWEHIECAISEGEGHPADRSPLFEFMDQHPEHEWNQDALKKSVNADISLSFPIGEYTNAQPVVVKFHCCPLEQVIIFEKKQSKLGKKDHGVVPVPEDIPSLVRSLIPPMGSDQKGGLFSQGKDDSGIC